ncbi:hypothetical protein [Hymenobacter rigui]|uniref:CHRD domain-containing protein n=1 Tax=Hymenobacter rigui TaxID=334424 RepID=A0A428KVR2_9BACT|nr:hypothetical protein [Hymenobacter rigui]RSK50787.1 hypothetical protein EI291_00245 [Hymenobacter rigui]
MKYLSLLLLLPALGMLTACNNDDTDAPAPVPATATYAEGSGAAVALSLPSVSYVTAVANGPGNQPRRAIVLRVTLPNGSVSTMTYNYAGSEFPAVGPVALDVPVVITPVTITGPGFQDGGSQATLKVESVTPQVVSGTYSGTFTMGGPPVRVVFNRLPL